ncbi:hypothetical protein QUF63_00525 [Anaerolineales bacterium HSG25]|nr:hypothetical protein [Anaerolineales bacterium HSG25]
MRQLFIAEQVYYITAFILGEFVNSEFMSPDRFAPYIKSLSFHS